MSMKRLFTNILIVFLVLVIIVLAAIIGFNKIDSNRNNSQPIGNVTDSPTNIPVTQITMQPAIPTAIPAETATPWIPVVVTNAPESVATATPEVWYIATVAPTVLPTEVVFTPTPKPVITATSVPTATPEPVITSTPVPTATPEPVITTTPVPTATLEPVITATPAPTATPTPVVTAAPATEAPPKYTKEALETARKELYKLTAGINEILPDYTSNKKYDLYNYISVDKINPNDLFVILKDIYINTLAHSLDFQFNYDNTIEGLEMTLNSAYCPNCGKVKCVYKTENDAKMTALLDSVKSSDIMNANMVMLNFLYTNSYVSNDNINERLIICCPCNK